MSLVTRQNELVIHPYNGQSKIVFFEGTSNERKLEFALFQFGNKKVQYVFASGLINRLKEILQNVSELEEQELAKILHSMMVNTSALDEGYKHVNDLHKDGFPNAAEAIDLCAYFYEQMIDSHDLARMKAIVEALS